MSPCSTRFGSARKCRATTTTSGRGEGRWNKSPTVIASAIGAGEETGKLDHVLQKVSGHYDREVDSSLKAATSLIEPLLITLMGGVVGAIAMSLLLPIFQLSRATG